MRGDTMTPAKLREAIEILGTNQSALARSIGVDPRTVRKWLAGENPIRTSAAILIRLRLADVRDRTHPIEA